MTDDRIAAIRERCEKATPGPWECGEFGFGISSERRNIYFAYGQDAQVFKDMQFTANSRTDIPYLLTEIDRLKHELADLMADYNGVMRIQAGLLHDKQYLNSCLEASQRREQAAVDAVNRMAEYIVTKGRVDDMLCDDIPQKLHLKHQPKNDGNYDNGPCIKCVAEYFMSVPKQEGGE